jgi:DNA-binding transcriptional MerR regulator
MGRLAEELKKRFKTPQEAMARLGIDSALLGDEWSTKARARVSAAKRGMAIDGLPDDADVEEFHDSVKLVDDDDENEEAESEMDPAEAREFRRWRMKELGRRLMYEKGFTLDQVRDLLRHPDFPQNALGESRSEQITEDAEVVMKELEGMGSGPLPVYEDMPKAKDRKMARDAAHRFNEWYDVARLAGSDMSHRYSGREPIAMDEMSAEDADRFERWYGTRRIGIA